MKPVLLHGPALVSSRKKLSDLKAKFEANSVVSFEKGADLKEIKANLQTVAMFDESLVVVENPPEDFLTDPSLTTSSLIVWFDKEVKKLPVGWEILFFPEARETSVFPWLDLLKAGKKEAFLELKKLKKSGFDNQYFITMVFYLLRGLVVDPIGAKDFVKNKNARARVNFPIDKVKEFYKFFLELDFKIKSGQVEPSQAEFLIVNQFIKS